MRSKYLASTGEECSLCPAGLMKNIFANRYHSASSKFLAYIINLIDLFLFAFISELFQQQHLLLAHWFVHRTWDISPGRRSPSQFSFFTSCFIKFECLLAYTHRQSFALSGLEPGRSAAGCVHLLFFYFLCRVFFGWASGGLSVIAKGVWSLQPSRTRPEYVRRCTFLAMSDTYRASCSDSHQPHPVLQTYCTGNCTR